MTDDDDRGGWGLSYDDDSVEVTGHYETDADIYVYYCSKFGTDNLEALLSYKFANVVDFT